MPFTRAETNQALAPARQLRVRCYDSSALARRHEKIKLEFRLEIAPTGDTRAFPTFADPDAPQIIECVRSELDALRFPARGHDRLQLHFEMGP